MQKIDCKSGEAVYLGEYLDDLRRELSGLEIGGLDPVQKIWTIPQGIVGNVISEKCLITIHPSVTYLTSEDYISLLVPPSLELEVNEGLFREAAGGEFSYRVIERFLQGLELLAKDGLPRRYASKDYSGSNLLGTIDWPKTAIGLAQQEAFPVRATTLELCPNTLPMRVIRMAYEFLKRRGLGGNKPSIERLVSSIDGGEPSLSALPPQHFYANESLVEHVYKTAILLLKGTNLSAKGNGLCTLLINSNRIFQDYINAVLRAFGQRLAFKKNFSIDIARNSRRLISGVLDYCLLGAVEIPLDVKNKNYYDELKSSDLYQLISYCNSLNTNCGILVYPVDSADTTIEQVVVLGGHSCNLYKVGISIKKATPKSRSQSERAFVDKMVWLTING